LELIAQQQPAAQEVPARLAVLPDLVLLTLAAVAVEVIRQPVRAGPAVVVLVAQTHPIMEQQVAPILGVVVAGHITRQHLARAAPVL
jgi:hypothetical protein